VIGAGRFLGELASGLVGEVVGLRQGHLLLLGRRRVGGGLISGSGLENRGGHGESKTRRHYDGGK
jgi:hypothetical protein